MPQNETLVVRGLGQFLVAARYAEASTTRVVRGKFREAGRIVQVEAAARFQQVDARTASGFRTVVRTRGVSVEQRLRKTTGLRPDFGALQMRKALVPALEAKTHEVERKLEEGLGELAVILERG